jgi:predicted metal-dependent hydrolase
MCSTSESRLPSVKGAGGDYRIRTSPRGRNVCLKISARDGLTVTIPRGFDFSRLPAILEKKRNWIETHLLRFSGISGAIARAPLAAPPDAIELPALGELWRIEYLPTKTRRIGVMMEEPGRLTVYGAVADHDACRAVLKKWLRRRTLDALVPWLDRLAEQEGFQFNDVLVRGQKTRWASCSSKGTITLSYKLLFLDRHFVRYILLHELCHTVYMNHSLRFWTLLSRLEPECRVLRRQMREEGKRVPAWVEDRE